MARNKKAQVEQDEVEQNTNEQVIEAGQPKSDLTPEQKAALKAEQKARDDEAKALKKAEKKAEREAAAENKKKQKEADKQAAIEAKQKLEQERAEALKPLADAVAEAEQNLTNAKANVETCIEALKTARAEYKAAGGKGMGATGDGLVDRGITSRYVAHDVKTPGGRKSTNNDDNLARATMGMSGADLIAILDAHGIEHNDWSHLNPGMQRMNAGNVLRTAIRKGKAITIQNGDQTFEVASLHD